MRLSAFLNETPILLLISGVIIVVFTGNKELGVWIVLGAVVLLVVASVYDHFRTKRENADAEKRRSEMRVVA